MNRTTKQEIVNNLAANLVETPAFYLFDMGGLKVNQDNLFRRRLFENNLKVKVIKNTLLIKALERASKDTGYDYTPLYEVLKGNTAILFIDEERYNLPARILRDFRKEEDSELPKLKAAFMEGDVYIGDDQLKALASLKSREELIGDVITLLQSPFNAVMQALQSGANTIMGLLEAIENKNQ